MMSNPTWQRDDSADQTIEDNWLFRLRRERFVSRLTGRGHDFYVIRLADAVHVIALTPDRRLVLVRQFRAGSGRDSLETPGGLVDPGEDVFTAGARELLEETGYAGDPPVLLGSTYSNPSLLTSRLATVLIANCRAVAEPKLDATEEVAIELIAARRLPELIRNGQIDHALVVQGLLLWLVGEVPDGPLSLARSDLRGRRPKQYTILSGMILVAGFGLGFGLIANFGFGGVLLLAVGFALPASFLLTRFVLDPAPRSILLRQFFWTPRRASLRLLASLGLGLVVFCALAILTRVVGLWIP
jgi:ADP-ribose pyrophosphatase